MARGSLAGLPSVVREAIDRGAGWQEVPWAHQGMEREVRVGMEKYPDGRLPDGRIVHIEAA